MITKGQRVKVICSEARLKEVGVRQKHIKHILGKIGKQSAKVVALNNRVDTTQFTDNSEKTVIVEITNITELDGKEIARKTTKRVVKNVTKEQKNKQKAKGAA